VRRLPALFVLVVLVAVLAGETGAGGVRLSRAVVTQMDRTCVVPNVKGKTVAAATRAIKRHGCRVGAVSRSFSRTVAKGRVISQRPRAGARRPMGSKIALVVSKGAPLPSVGTVVARIPVPNAPLGLLALPGAVWVAAHRSDSVYRIDTASNTVVAHVVVAQGGEQPGRMTFGDGTLFAENYSGDAVSLIDPSLNTLKSVITAPLEDCCWPAYGAGSLWLLEFSSSGAQTPDRLVRLDPSGKVLTTMNLTSAFGLTFGAGSVWGASDGRVFRLDPTTNQIVARISTDAAPIAFGAGSVWGLSGDSRQLIRIDPASNSVSATIRLPAPGSAVTATDTAVWVAEGPGDSPGSRLWKIDPATNRVAGQVRLGGIPSALDDLAVGEEGDVWVSAFGTNQVLRVHPG
jgi:YVTN family beta-propeller protein